MSATTADGPGTSLRWLWLAAAVVVLDQATKWAIVQSMELFEVNPILPVLDITRLHNTGAAFSFLAQESGWQRWLFIGLGAVVIVGIVYWLRSLPARGHAWLGAALALVMGGALGNVIDRVWHGHVVDFIHVHWNTAYFPAFNVADSAITVGAAVLILDAILESRRHRHPPVGKAS